MEIMEIIKLTELVLHKPAGTDASVRGYFKSTNRVCECSEKNLLCCSYIMHRVTRTALLSAFISVPPAGLGWGKPVKPDPWKMRVGADTGVLLVACAGLICNLIIGLLVAVLFRFLDPILDTSFFAHLLRQWVLVFASVNIGLALFNLIPVYPLDG